MARTNFQIKVGTYTGDGVDNTNITGVGFRPDLVIIKGGANVACWKTKDIRDDFTMFFAGNTANFSDGIQKLTSNGFQIGTDAKVNADGTTYYYIAIRGTAGQRYFYTGLYKGNGSDGRNFTTGGIDFTPDLVWIKGDTNQNPSTRTTEVSGDNSWHFAGVADAADEIQNLQSNGFQLGTSARVNTNGMSYFFTAFKKLAGVIATGTYTGNGGDSREITGIGFQPDVVIVKDGTTTAAAIIRTSDFSGDSSASLGAAAPTTNQIQALSSDGFQVGTDAKVNASAGDTYWWVAFKTGDHNVPLTRTAA